MKVNLLKTPADFTELLDLQDLITQSTVLKHLQNNQRKYQESFIKSFIKNRNDVLKYIPANHWNDYKIVKLDTDTHYNGEYSNVSKKYLSGDWSNIYRMDFNTKHFGNADYEWFQESSFISITQIEFKNQFSLKHNFIIDTTRKLILLIPEFRTNFKINIDENILTLSFKETKRINVESYYRCTYYNEMSWNFKYSFDLQTNTVADCSYNYSVDNRTNTDKY